MLFLCNVLPPASCSFHSLIISHHPCPHHPRPRLCCSQPQHSRHRSTRTCSTLHPNSSSSKPSLPVLPDPVSMCECGNVCMQMRLKRKCVMCERVIMSHDEWRMSKWARNQRASASLAKRKANASDRAKRSETENAMQKRGTGSCKAEWHRQERKHTHTHTSEMASPRNHQLSMVSMIATGEKEKRGKGTKKIEYLVSWETAAFCHQRIYMPPTASGNWFHACTSSVSVCECGCCVRDSECMSGKTRTKKRKKRKNAGEAGRHGGEQKTHTHLLSHSMCGPFVPMFPPSAAAAAMRANDDRDGEGKKKTGWGRDERERWY